MQVSAFNSGRLVEVVRAAWNRVVVGSEAPPFGMIGYSEVFAGLGVLGVEMHSLWFDTNVD